MHPIKAQPMHTYTMIDEKSLEFDYTFVDEEEKLLIYYWKSIIA